MRGISFKNNLFFTPRLVWWAEGGWVNFCFWSLSLMTIGKRFVKCSKRFRHVLTYKKTILLQSTWVQHHKTYTYQWTFTTNRRRQSDGCAKFRPRRERLSRSCRCDFRTSRCARDGQTQRWQPNTTTDGVRVSLSTADRVRQDKPGTTVVPRRYTSRLARKRTRSSSVPDHVFGVILI